MNLTRIEASGFRNLEGEAQFGPDINIFYGDNAQGKTNWLEAIYVLGNTRSFRTSQLRDCIRFDSERFILRGETSRGTITKGIQLAVSATSRELFVNGKREVTAQYLGNLDVFAFSLEEMDVIRGEPANRRRFIDRGVATITPGFVTILSQYNQVTKQKNRLLSEASQSDNPRSCYDQLQAWNEQMVELGVEIHNGRVDYVERLNRVLNQNDYGRAIFGGERIGIRYKSQLEGKGDLGRYRELYGERLALRMAAEVAAGHSLIGPHRDELEILADGREVARFGSAGQQRSALLLLDLAQLSIYNSVYEESPTLVIDDIDAELDRSRIEALLSELDGNVQTFISTSRRGIASRYKDRASLFHVEGGRAASEAASNGVRTPSDPYAEALLQVVPTDDHRNAQQESGAKLDEESNRRV